MENGEITNLMVLKLFRQCSHLQDRRIGRFHEQGRILILLHEYGRMTQRELIEITQRRSATLSEQLERMESSGLIVREKNEADKRNVDVFLTEEGRREAARAERRRARRAEELFSALDGEERAALYRTLLKLSALWQEQGENGQTDCEERV